MLLSVIQGCQIMRQINDKRKSESSREYSKGQTLGLDFFRQSGYSRGHARMRRTQFSCERLQKVVFHRKLESQEQQHKKKDYIDRQRQKNIKSEGLDDKPKKIGQYSNKTKFFKRITLFPRPRLNKKLENHSSAKQRGRIPLLPPEKQCSSQKQIRYPPTRKRKIKEYLPSRTIQEEDGQQLYQVESFMEKQKQRESFRKFLKPQIQQSTCKVQEKIKKVCVPVPNKQVKEVLEKNEKKIKKQQSTISTLRNSLLPIFSRQISILPNILSIESINNKITVHLEIIAKIAEYSKQLLEVYEDSSDWEELAFLTYKKYYLERIKVARALRGIGSNPFQLNVCRLTSQELQNFRKRIDGIKLAKQFTAENRKFADSLRSFYNLIIQKSGNFINMEERDDFIGEILQEIKQQIELLKEIDSQSAKKRMGKVYQCAFLISELSGNRIISYEQSLDMDLSSYLLKASNLFSQCLKL